MTSRVSSPILLLGATLILIVGLAIAFRTESPTVVPSNSGSTTGTSPDSNATVPEFTSTTFLDGDLMKGLGPEWTYLRTSELESSDARALPGLVPDRESVVKLVDQSVEMTLAEYDIEDQAKLDALLTSYPTSIVGDRAGWIIPLNDIVGGKGFLLKGSRSALLISLSGSAEWPKELPSAVTSFIAAIRVP